MKFSYESYLPVLKVAEITKDNIESVCDLLNQNENNRMPSAFDTVYRYYMKDDAIDREYVSGIRGCVSLRPYLVVGDFVDVDLRPVSKYKIDRDYERFK